MKFQIYFPNEFMFKHFLFKVSQVLMIYEHYMSMMSCDLEEISYIEQIFSEKMQGQIPNATGDSCDFDEKTKEPVVLLRGRFKVTSESVDVEKVQT